VRTIRFQYLILENFKSFRGQHVFVFPDGNGLYFLAGNNLRNEAIGSNGAGKSSIWDALFWVLRGTSVRGKKAKTLLNRQTDAKGYAVTLGFSVKESEDDVAEPFEIKRTWNPNSLTWRREGADEWTELTDEEIIQWFRLTPSQFLTSVLFGQGQPFFLNLSPADKMALFDDILDLDYWNRLSEFVAGKEKEQDRILQQATSEISGADGALATIPSSIENFQKNRDEWFSQHVESIQGRKAKREALKEEYVSTVRLRDELSWKIQKQSEAVATVKLNQPDPTANALLEIERQKVVIHTQLERDQKSTAFYQNNVVCSECQQPIDPDFRETMLASLENEREDLERQKVELQKKEEILNQQKKEYLQEQERKKKELQTLDALAQYYKAELGFINSRINKLASDGKELSAEIEKLEKESNPWDESIQTLEKKKNHYEAEKAKWMAVQTKAQAEKELCSFWKEHFRKVRVFLSGQILSQLSFDIQMALGQLGLSDWNIELSSEETLQSGKKKTAISVTIDDGQSDDGTAWESSGGEGQRLALATAIGLSSFIQRLAGVSIPFEIWDEPTDGLSKEGVRALIQFLSDWSRMSGKQIWIVDHSIHHAGLFDGICTIEKDAHGNSRILPLTTEMD